VVILILLLPLYLFSQSQNVRIGFIGNSITIGSGLSNPTVEAYPSQLGLLLKEKYGDTCIIKNFAVSGRTLLKKGDFPWWNEPDFTRCLNYAPDICFISLGTNDSKPYNWDDSGADFYSDYQSLIDTFKFRNPETKFIVCLPPPAFAVEWGIRNFVIVDSIIPLIDSLAKINSLDVVDFYHPLVDSVNLFPDKIHPNAKGAKVFAKIAFDEIVSSDIIHKVKTVYTFVTGLTSSVPDELRLTDKATISWTSVNATEVFLNGELVANDGSLLVSPTETTIYKLLAIGELSSDSLTLEQKVYIPKLFRFTITAPKRTIMMGETLKLKINYLDQNSKPITDSVYDITWSVSQGTGHFINKSDNTIEFIGDASGTVKILAQYKDISYSFAITVKPYPTDVKINESERE